MALLSDKPIKQGGVFNFLGQQPEVTAPKFWQSSEDSPPTELAYITEAEKDLLLNADLHGSLKGSPNIGASGILSFDGWGSEDPGQNVAGADISAGMDTDPGHSGWSDGRGSTAVAEQAMTPAKQEKVVAQNILDLVEGGVNINDAISGKTSIERILQSKTPFKTVAALNEFLSPVANKHNQWRRTNWLEGTDEYGFPLSRDFYIANQRAFNPTATLIEGTPEHDFLIETGYFDQFNKDDNNQGGDGNPESLFDYREDFTMDNITNFEPESQVDKWFANNQAGTGLDPNYLNTYNTAKAQIANTMGMVDTSNQFGYSATPYGGLTAQNLGTNPFNIAWMQQRGLI
jgi:hypothetical protein